MDILKDEMMRLLATMSDAVAATTRIRHKDSRISGYVQIVRRLLPLMPIKRYEGRAYVYNGRYWQCTPWNKVGEDIYNAMLDSGIIALDARHVFGYARSSIPEFTPEKTLVAFENVLYDWRLYRVMDFTPERYCIRSLDYQYRKHSRGKMWPRFLQQVLPDINDRKAIQEFFGSVFLDRDKISIEKFLLMIGEGANGKSVLIKCVSAAIGKDVISYMDPKQLADERMLEALRGKMLNIASDVKNDSKLSAALKPLVSFEEVEAWKLFRGRVTVKAPPLAFAMNHIPSSSDMSDGMKRRLLPIIFSVTVPPEERDAKLAAKMIKYDLPAIFNWLMVGARRLKLQRGEFTVPANSELTVREIERVSLPILDALGERGYYPKPLWRGQKPEYKNLRDIRELSGFSDFSAQDIRRNMRNAGFEMAVRNGYRCFAMYKDAKVN